MSVGLRPWLTNSLFPQLPRRSRRYFRVALIVLAAVLAGFSVLRWSVPMLGVAMSGVPALFLIYLRETGVPNRDVPARYVALVTVLAAGLGVGWALVAGPAIAGAYNTAVVHETSVVQRVVWWVAIPLSEALLMIAPGLLVRAVDRTRRKPLDGFIIGALGAVIANGASTATLLAPQLSMGITADTEPMFALLVEAVVEGLAWPVATLATGGIFGIAVRLSRSPSSSRRPKWQVVAALLLVLANLTAMGVVDVIPLSQTPYLGLQLLMAVLAVVGLSIAIASCAGRSVTGLTLAPCASEGQPSDLTDARSYHKSGYLRVLGPLTAGVVTTVVIGLGVAMLTAPAPERFVCPPDCGRPPLGDPVETNPRFSGDDGAFSVAYPGEGSAYEVTLDPPGINGVQMKYVAGDTGTVTLFGEKAEERSPKDIAHQLLRAKFPDATIDYEIPNASVGYQPGYGLVADVYPRDTSSGYPRQRVIIMTAIRYDYALIAMASGPYHKFSPSYGTGHPSGANLEVAMDMGKYVNSFKWNGDRYGRPS